MTERPTFLNTQWIYFISRLLILTGMLLVFTALGAGLGYLAVKLFFGADTNIADLMDIHKTNPQTVQALKLFQSIAVTVMFLLPALLFPGAIKANVSWFLKIKNPTPYFSWPFAIAIMIVSAPLVSWLYQVNQGLTLPASMSAFEAKIRLMEAQAAELTKIFVAANSIGMLLLNLFVVAVIPAVCEEFFFRGVVQNFIKSCFLNETLAIIFAALIFSAFHNQYFGFVPRFFLGIVLGYIYAISGNIWVSVLAHFFNNALAVIMMYNAKFYPDIAIFNEEYVFPLPVSILSGMLVIGLILLYRKMFSNLVIRTLVDKVGSTQTTGNTFAEPKE